MDRAKPYRLGIIFVHGIQGRPEQLAFLTKCLPDTVLVRSVLLPGHGLTVREFRRSGSRQWLSALKADCLWMREQCDKTIFVGHSMGCLLGLLAEQENRIFAGMLLVCCPFHFRLTLRYVRYSCLAACTKRNSPYVDAVRKANGVYARHAISYLTCFRPYMELFKLMRKTRTQPLHCPDATLFCFAEKDEIVSKRSILYVKNALHTEVRLLPDCGHNYFPESAKAYLTKALSDILSRI